MLWQAVFYGGCQLGEAGDEVDGAVILQETVGAATCEYDAVAGAALSVDEVHGIGEGDLQRAEFRYGYFHLDGVLEGGGLFVAALDGDYGRDHPFGFHPVESEAYAVHPVHTRLLHNADIVGMVRDAHPVALIILDFMPVMFHAFLTDVGNFYCIKKKLYLCRLKINVMLYEKDFPDGNGWMLHDAEFLYFVGQSGE